jgi:hypothetical protein
MALSAMSLESLTIQPHHEGGRGPLELRQVTPADLLHMLRRWQSLAFLRLDMLCTEVSCTALEEETICKLLSTMNIGTSSIDVFVRTMTLIQMIRSTILATKTIEQ